MTTDAVPLTQAEKGKIFRELHEREAAFINNSTLLNFRRLESGASTWAAHFAVLLLGRSLPPRARCERPAHLRLPLKLQT
jgi:hypothetical protein